jgi:hypothetical protein
MLYKKIPDPSFEDHFSRITQASSQITAMVSLTKGYEKIGMGLGGSGHFFCADATRAAQEGLEIPDVNFPDKPFCKGSVQTPPTPLYPLHRHISCHKPA